MDAMSFCDGCYVWVLLQSAAIISALPNLLLTGDEASRLIDAGRLTSDDARRIFEGQATPEEVAQLKAELISLSNGSKPAPASQQQQQQQQPQHQPKQSQQQVRLKTFGSTGCDVNPCRNGGSCTMQGSLSNEKTACICARGYYGEFCDYDSPECETEPCLHNGECQRSTVNAKGYKCLCPAGYMGDNCEVTLGSDSVTAAAAADLQSKSILLRPSSIIIFFSIVFFCLGMAFVSTVEAERKVLTERYRVLISVGYRVDYPHIEFYRLAAMRIRILCCCICYTLPCCTCGDYDEEDEGIPLPPNMRGVDLCAQLKAVNRITTLSRNPSQQSQLSHYGQGGLTRSKTYSQIRATE